MKEFKPRTLQEITLQEINEAIRKKFPDMSNDIVIKRGIYGFIKQIRNAINKNHEKLYILDDFIYRNINNWKELFGYYFYGRSE